MATGELGWQNLSRALAGLSAALSSLLAEGLDVPNSPRAAIKAGLDRGFVLESEYQAALDLLADRNTCSHIYRQSLIPGILARLPAHGQAMEAITARLPSEP